MHFPGLGLTLGSDNFHFGLEQLQLDGKSETAFQLKGQSEFLHLIQVGKNRKVLRLYLNCLRPNLYFSFFLDSSVTAVRHQGSQPNCTPRHSYEVVFALKPLTFGHPQKVSGRRLAPKR